MVHDECFHTFFTNNFGWPFPLNIFLSGATSEVYIFKNHICSIAFSFLEFFSKVFFFFDWWNILKKTEKYLRENFGNFLRNAALKENARQAPVLHLAIFLKNKIIRWAFILQNIDCKEKENDKTLISSKNINLRNHETTRHRQPTVV